MSSLPITRTERDRRGRFVIAVEGRQLAEMTYSRVNDRIVIIDHTEVSDELRGQGAGKQLVLAAVAWAREEGQRIVPLCPFARATFEKHPELGDVLAS